MKLISKYKDTSSLLMMSEYYCDVTSELDRLAGLDSNCCWKHYILADKFNKKERCLAIRIPGGTLGDLEYDENNIITRIYACTDYVVKTYPDDVNAQLQKFVGQKIEIGE